MKFQVAHITGHPLAQRPHIPRPLGLKDLKKGGFGTLRPHFGATLDVGGACIRLMLCQPGTELSSIRLNAAEDHKPRQGH